MGDAKQAGDTKQAEDVKQAEEVKQAEGAKQAGGADLKKFKAYISITICSHQKKLFQENIKSGSFHKFIFYKFYYIICMIKSRQIVKSVSSVIYTRASKKSSKKQKQNLEEKK